MAHVDVKLMSWFKRLGKSSKLKERSSAESNGHPSRPGRDVKDPKGKKRAADSDPEAGPSSSKRSRKAKMPKETPSAPSGRKSSK